MLYRDHVPLYDLRLTQEEIGMVQQMVEAVRYDVEAAEYKGRPYAAEDVEALERLYRKILAAAPCTKRIN